MNIEETIEELVGVGYFVVCPVCRSVLCPAPMGVKIGDMCCVECKTEYKE